MSKVRAKVRCQSVTFFGAPENPASQRQLTFMPIYDTSTPENERFTKSTPSGELRLTVDNPEAKFEVGAYYYVDFVKADQ